MAQLKKQMIGVISALILIFAAILGFEIIGQIYCGTFGKNAKEAFVLATEKHFGKIAVVFLISTVVLCVLGLFRPGLTKILYIMWGVIVCVDCFVISMHTGSQSVFYDCAIEVELSAIQATRLFMFVYGAAFPILHLVLCLYSCGDSLKKNLINQGITVLFFLFLFPILLTVVWFANCPTSLGCTIAACLSVIITAVLAFLIGLCGRYISCSKNSSL